MSSPHTTSPSTAVTGSDDTSALLRNYLTRGVIALAWAAAFAVFAGSLSSGTIVLLTVYPLIDAIGSYVDLRKNPVTAGRNLQLFNIALSTLAAVAVGYAATVSVPLVLQVFGAWAALSGLSQVVGALRRRSSGLANALRQWPLLLAGGLSVLVGVVYNIRALGDDPVLHEIILYAAAGGIFYVIQTILLVRRSRRAGSGRS